MGDNMPKSISDLINWCNVHVDLWTLNSSQINMAAPTALAFKNAVSAMVTSNAAAEAAREASKNATIVLRGNINIVRTLGSANIASIKGFAETTRNVNVYALGGVSPSDPPSPVPAPLAPDMFTAGVNPDGSLTIKWKVTQPTGVSNVTYIVSRRINGGGGGAGAFTIVANEGSNKTFLDKTLPIGVDKVEYMVQPKRGNVFGAQSNIFTVQFGSVAGGGAGGLNITTTESVPHLEPMKIAA